MNSLGLYSFPENSVLRSELLLDRYSKPDSVVMQTSTGGTQEYHMVGQVNFKVNGEDAALQVYEASDNPGSDFMPFVDATAPGESYGAGRYLEPEKRHADELVVDFNFCYNSYCTDNSNWSCPFPTPNRSKVRIEAGEKNYHE